MQCFLSSKVVNTRPRHRGPAVIDLPIKAAHGAWHDSSEVFRCGLHCNSLGELAEIDKTFKIPCSSVKALDSLGYSLYSDSRFLMGLHHFRVRRKIFASPESPNGFEIWKRLKAKFTHEAGELSFEFFERKTRKPDIPVMNVSYSL